MIWSLAADTHAWSLAGQTAGPDPSTHAPQVRDERQWAKVYLLAYPMNGMLEPAR